MQVSSENIIVIVVVITLVLMTAGVAILMYVRLYNEKKQVNEEEKMKMKKHYENELLRSQVEVRESTVTAIGKELHDNVGQLLSTTKMLLGITEINLSPVPDTLSTANATLSKAIQELRFISRSLDKEWLEQFDFSENLDNEIRRINAGGVIKASYDTSARLPMVPDKQLILFRIVQEAIQNALKHATPGYISVDVKEAQQELHISIRNDGLPLPDHVQGMGTNNMKHRVQLFGGTIRWLSHEDHTEVKIIVPINEQA